MSNIDAEVTSQDFSGDDEVSESPENEENTQNDTVEDNNSVTVELNSPTPQKKRKVQKYELKMIMDQEQILAPHPASCSSPAYFQQPSPIERYQQSNNSSTLASPPSEDFQHETNSSANGNQRQLAQ
ncbi:hypothetical protein FQR65_LT17919 [Abscondita terminalis]|nr:hypothetical protein FQR65_LT17919 [Abscondita terminalis]